MINDLWYKNAIIYCMSVETYMDANGDGIGDFLGLTRRLDYLHGLGITAIWLMPFQVSPGRDDGYDVADYYSVDPRYGTLKPGNAGGGKGPQFKTDARRSEGPGDWAT
jgi:maltose alpha-D-glucosyltransferase/alpha-amylase